MPRPKGSQNKVTTEVKEQLQNLIHQTIDSIEVGDLDANQRLKLLQLSLHYVLPKLRLSENVDTQHQDEPIFVEVWGRKDGSDEDEWKDNFEVVDTHVIDPKKAS